MDSPGPKEGVSVGATVNPNPPVQNPDNRESSVKVVASKRASSKKSKAKGASTSEPGSLSASNSGGSSGRSTVANDGVIAYTPVTPGSRSRRPSQSPSQGSGELRATSSELSPSPRLTQSAAQGAIESFVEGQRVRITISDGAEFQGVFRDATVTCYVLKEVVQTRFAHDYRRFASPGTVIEMSFQKKDTTEARGISGKAEGKPQNGNAGFRTDSAISSARRGGDRVLQPWVPDSSDDKTQGLGNQSLESSNGQPWDQFAVNEQKFGLVTDYDENMYTTRINTSHPNHKQRLAFADKKAREIERSVATSSHIAEERVMDYAGCDDNADEEDKYSGVKRQDFPPLPGSRDNKYTPPARRAPTGTATVKGAPFDPAIISSQLKGVKSTTPKAEETNSVSPATPVSATAAAAKEMAPASAQSAKTPELVPEAKGETQAKAAEGKSSSQSATPLKPSAATSRTISPQAKEPVAPNATSTVERDVLKEFKTFANQQRMNAEKQRSTKMKADKEVKLNELKNFAKGFKLPTPVPVDLIGIIAKDPAKQREIQEKAQRDVAEIARRKADEVTAKEKKATPSKDAQGVASATPQAAPAAERNPRAAVGPGPSSTAPTQSTSNNARHAGSRGNYMGGQYVSYRNDRGGPQNLSHSGQGTLARRIHHAELQKGAVDVRPPPTGPANATDFRRLTGIPGHMGPKLNPNSNEFRPLAAPFVPNGHPSAGSSPRSAINNTTDPANAPAAANGPLVVVTKKKNAIDPQKCNILGFVKSLPVPQGKNWDDNQGVKPSFDTPPTWRQALDDEKADSTMRLSYTEFFERQPFSTQPTPNTGHSVPQMAHQHQLPFHLQHGAHSAGPRQASHGPPMQIHPGQHVPGPHMPYNNNGADDHRMMHSNSSQSYSSPRMGHVPMAYPANMGSPAQMPYNQGMVPSFMPGTSQQMGQYGRSFSNTPQYMPQQQVQMGNPVMMQPQFMAPQGMPAPQMHMYPGGNQQFIPPGAAVSQPMPGANGYPSPGRPTAPMMVPQGSHQGQPMYAMSPAMQFQQPAFPQQPGQMNNMRGYSNPSPHQFGTSPQQMHHYGPQQHRNSNNGFKGYHGHNQSPAAQGGPIPTGPQGRAADGQDEAK